MKRASLALVAVTILTVVGTSLYGQDQPQNQDPRPVRSRADETLAMWNNIGHPSDAAVSNMPHAAYLAHEKVSATAAQSGAVVVNAK